MITRDSSKSKLDHIATNFGYEWQIHTDTVRCEFSDHNMTVARIDTTAQHSADTETTTRQLGGFG